MDVDLDKTNDDDDGDVDYAAPFGDSEYFVDFTYKITVTYLRSFSRMLYVF